METICPECNATVKYLPEESVVKCHNCGKVVRDRDAKMLRAAEKRAKARYFGVQEAKKPQPFPKAIKGVRLPCRGYIFR